MIQIGDVVVKSDTSKRLFWKLGIVQQLLKGTDGQVRAAVVRVPESNRLLRRSVKHLYPIEVRQETSQDASFTEQAEISSEKRVKESPELNNRRPRRLAAIVGEQLRRNS